MRFVGMGPLSGPEIRKTCLKRLQKTRALRMMMARLTLWLLTLNWFGPLAWLPHVRL
jgi:hypothetical protein